MYIDVFVAFTYELRVVFLLESDNCRFLTQERLTLRGQKMPRVTRLNEFSTFGRLFPVGIFFLNYLSDPIFFHKHT
jgi:hypothetical protein